MSTVGRRDTAMNFLYLGFPRSGALNGTLSYDDTLIVRMKRSVMIHTDLNELCVMLWFVVSTVLTSPLQVLYPPRWGWPT